MAAPKFDTTVVKPTYPGLTYKVDKAMPAKFNNMEAILGIAEMGIKKADEIDKSNTINEANDLGNVLADEIENSSPSYLNSLEQDKLRLEEEVKNNPEDLEIQADLNAITTRYSNANAQGMSKYESERRILQKTQELANANPAYADEIALRVSKTLGNRGVTSLMEQDNLLYTNQLKKQNADNKIIDDYLRTKPGVTPMFMEDEDRKIAYLTYKKIDREEAEILQKIEDGSIRSKENIAEVQNKIDLSGGINCLDLLMN